MLSTRRPRPRRALWLALALGALIAAGCTTPMETALGTRCRQHVDAQRFRIWEAQGHRFIGEMDEVDRFMLWDECMERRGLVCATGGGGQPGRHYCGIRVGHRMLNEGVTNPYDR